MATEVKIDIVDGARIRQTAEGIETTRIARVSGIVGAASERMALALDATDVIGTAHPTISDIRLEEKYAEAESWDAARVTLVYRTPSLGSLPPQEGDPPQIEVGASLQSTTTQKDYAGNDMSLFYTPTDEEVANGEMLDQSYEVVATANVQVPQVYVRYTRREAQAPSNLAATYVGKVNATSVFGDDPKFWLCSQINGVSSDGGQSYIVTYEFIRASDPDIGWDVRLRSEKDGKPMAGTLTEGTHIKNFQVYQTAEFNNLNL